MPNVEQRQDEWERWRVRLWATATAGLWVVTAAYLLILVFTYLMLLHPAVNEFVTGGEMNERARQDFAAAIIDWVWALLWWPVTLIVAAACTTWFTLASRRATLRQRAVGRVTSARPAGRAPGPRWFPGRAYRRTE
ncbi:MAG: hypothetical protein ACYTAQ_06860 [Planctomycetota bacterium]|jgi:hypothetical protein